MDLEYVDEITMFSNMATDLEARLYVFGEDVSKLGLELSWGKTKVIHVRDGPDPLTISSAVVEYVSSFNYLASIIIHTGALSEEIN